MRKLIATGRLLRDAWLMLGLAIILFCLLESGARLIVLAQGWAVDSPICDLGPMLCRFDPGSQPIRSSTAPTHSVWPSYV